MSSKTEDFPTPVSPMRRMVYDAFALLAELLMIPFLRDSTSLENTVRNCASKGVLATHLIVGIVVLSPTQDLAYSSSGGVLLRGPAELMADWLVAFSFPLRTDQGLAGRLTG